MFAAMSLSLEQKSEFKMLILYLATVQSNVCGKTKEMHLLQYKLEKPVFFGFYKLMMVVQEVLYWIK